jgi:ABC-type phosphate transport system substrate-binding protein
MGRRTYTHACRAGLLLGFLLMALASGLPPAAQEEPGFKVVVNADNPIRELPRRTLSEMFLNKVKRWENGGAEVEHLLVEPVDQPDDTALWDEFSVTVHRKRPSLVKRYWQKIIFSGRGRPPLTRESDEKVLEFVGERVGAVGYVSAGVTLPSTVRVLRVDYERK